MPKRCPDCHQMNDDGRIYCSFCGEPLDANVRLIKGLEKEIATAPREETKTYQGDDDDYEYIPTVRQKKEKNYAPLIIGVVLVLAVAAWFLLSR